MVHISCEKQDQLSREEMLETEVRLYSNKPDETPVRIMTQEKLLSNPQYYYYSFVVVVWESVSLLIDRFIKFFHVVNLVIVGLISFSQGAFTKV
jgi:hypothetical protein